MSDRLLLRLHADGSLAWLALDAGGRALSGANAGAPPPATLARARQIVVLVPSEHVLLLDAPRIAGTRTQVAKAVPFALEDQLASPVEDLHFALPERLDGERLAVAVVARATLGAWLARLAEDGIRPDVLIPETLALADPGGGLVVVENGRALVRLGAHASACDVAGLADWLALAAAGAAVPPALTVHDFRDEPRLALPVPVVSYRIRQHDALAFLAAGLPREPALNLLQGEFAPAHRQMPARQLWRRAAALVAAAVVLAFVYSGADCWRLARESAHLDEAMQATLHEAFPTMDKVLGDPRQVMGSALARLHGGGDAFGLLHALAEIGPVLGSTTRVALRNVEYHNAALEIGVRAPDVGMLDVTREQITHLPGLKAEVTAANAADGGGIDGRVRISAAGAHP
ncbi:MAG TPA: type II secretion system protein GspL [Rudaea sp.]|nr:type II secretion system protein GspL [Rudaea sp.]